MIKHILPGIPKTFILYWKGYGGWKAIGKSGYIRLALIIHIFSYRIWLSPSWIDTVVGILPNLIGFTLGGYAILLSFGNDDFQKFLIRLKNDTQRTIYMSVSSTFAHFIVIQTIALLFALFMRGTLSLKPELLYLQEIWPWCGYIIQTIKYIGWSIGYLMFLYSVSLTLAATMAVFKMSDWFCRILEEIIKREDVELTVDAPPDIQQQ